MLYLAQCSFPASGLRGDAFGLLKYVGLNGYSWLSSTYGSGSASGVTFLFGADIVSPFGDFHRDSARPVRCVQESTTDDHY